MASMKNGILSLTCILITLCLTSCKENILKGEGPKGTKTLQVASFNAISIDIPTKAIITVQANAQPGIQLSGYENIIKHIKTKIENNVLHITTDLDETWSLDINDNDDLMAQITVPSLAALTLSGQTDADIHGDITGNDFKLDISGQSSVVIDNINVQSFSSEVSGQGDIEVKAGTAKTAKYAVSGQGTIKTFPLSTEETSASFSGEGDGEVTASQKLTASLSGEGSIKYKGHPAITKNISGEGSISDAN